MAAPGAGAATAVGLAGGGNALLRGGRGGGCMSACEHFGWFTRVFTRALVFEPGNWDIALQSASTKSARGNQSLARFLTSGSPWQHPPAHHPRTTPSSARAHGRRRPPPPRRLQPPLLHLARVDTGHSDDSTHTSASINETKLIVTAGKRSTDFRECLRLFCDVHVL